MAFRRALQPRRKAEPQPRASPPASPADDCSRSITAPRTTPRQRGRKSVGRMGSDARGRSPAAALAYSEDDASPGGRARQDIGGELPSLSPSSRRRASSRRFPRNDPDIAFLPRLRRNNGHRPHIAKCDDSPRGRLPVRTMGFQPVDLSKPLRFDGLDQGHRRPNRSPIGEKCPNCPKLKRWCAASGRTSSDGRSPRSDAADALENRLP